MHRAELLIDHILEVMSPLWAGTELNEYGSKMLSIGVWMAVLPLNDSVVTLELDSFRPRLLTNKPGRQLAFTKPNRLLELR